MKILLLAMVAPVAVLSGCGSHSPPGYSPAVDAGGTSSEGGLLATGSDAGRNGDAGTFGATDSSVPQAPDCSADLHSVLGPDGMVTMTCPPDEGCSNGVCVPACDAAAAAKGSLGCDFVVSTPAFTWDFLPPCFASFIANGWGTSVTVQVSYGTQSLDPTTFGRVPDGTATVANWPALAATGVASGDVAVLFLSSDPNSKHPDGTALNCPVPDAVNQGTAIYEYVGTEIFPSSGVGTTFHIVTSAPVSLYDILPFGGARSFLPSAQLVLPTTAWGTNFIAVTPKETQSGGPQWLQVVASKDNTHVKVQPTQPLPAGTGVVAANPGQTASYTVDSGQFVQWSYNADLSGTVFSSDQPIAVVSGTNLCLESATSPMGGGCDSAHQTMLPVNALGYQYVAQPFATRMASLAPESIPYRLVGTANGTQLTYDPAGVGPATIAQGQVVEFESTVPFTVASQDNGHVFYMTQMMAGCIVAGGSRPGITPGIDTQLNLNECLGDEEFVDVLPPAQWLSKYVFFTDPTYATTNVTVARRATANGSADVTIDCTGTVTGWQPVGTGGQFEVANVDLIRAGTAVGSCVNGGHLASSSAPFGLVVWGEDEFASYAYPAGGNVSQINDVVVPVQ